MPRSGSRSKKGRAKARQAATTSDAPTASATTNSFAALAPPAAAGDGEKADEEEEEEEEEETAGAAAGTTERTAAAAADIPPTTNSPTPGGAAGEESSLAEDLLAAPSHLAANDPVRIKMAAYLEQCMLTGATPWPWVMEIVLPPTNGTPLGGPTSRQIGELITSMANIEKAIVSKLTAVGGRGKSVSFDASAHSADKRGRSPASDAGKRRKHKVDITQQCDYPPCRHRESHTRSECRLAQSHEKQGWVLTKKP